MLFAWTSATTFAQTFKKVYTPAGGAKFDAVFGLDEHASGFYLGGASQPGGRFVMKTDATGTVLWSRSTPTQNAVGGVVAAADGGVVLLESGAGNPVVVRKLDAAGAEVWARAYELNTQGPTRIAPHPGGGTLVSATSTVPVALRHDDDGHLVSALRIPQEFLFGAKAATDGSLVSWGRATNGRYSFVSSATNGFEMDFGNVAQGFGYPPVRLADGAWAAGAVVNLSGEPGLRIAFVKADGQLHLSQRKISTAFDGSLQGLSNVFVSEPAPTPDGGILVPLLFQKENVFESKIVKLDADLNVQWTRFIKAGTNPQEAYFTIKHTPSGYALGGTLLTFDGNALLTGEVLFESVNADLTGCTGFETDPNFSMADAGTHFTLPFMVWSDFVPTPATVSGVPTATTLNVTELCAPPPNGNCAAPANLSVLNVRATTAMLRWRPAQGASAYELSYRVAPNGAWTTQTLQGIVRRITGLQAGKTYQWRVRAVCINGGFSSYASGPDFSAPACDAPNAPTVSDIAFTSAKISWVLDGNQHKIRYRPVGTQTWTEVSANGANASPRTLTGLTPGTEYEVAVSKRCSPPGNTWSSVGNATRFWTQTAPTGVNDNGIAYNRTIQYFEVTANDFDVNGDKVTMSPNFYPVLVNGSGVVGRIEDRFISFRPDNDFEGTAIILYRPFDGFTEGNDTELRLDVKSTKSSGCPGCKIVNHLSLVSDGDGCFSSAQCPPLSHDTDFNFSCSFGGQFPGLTERCEVCYGPNSAACPISQNYSVLPFESIDGCQTNLLFARPGKKYGSCAIDEGVPMTVWGLNSPRIFPAGNYCFSFFAFNPTPKPSPISGNFCFSFPIVNVETNGAIVASLLLDQPGIWIQTTATFTSDGVAPTSIRIITFDNESECPFPPMGNEFAIDQLELYEIGDEPSLSLSEAYPDPICEGECVTLNYHTNVPLFCGHQCPPGTITVVPDGDIVVNYLTRSITYCGTETQTFTVTVRDPGGKCEASEDFTVTVIPRPFPTVEASPSPVCSSHVVLLKVADINNTSGIVYSWQPGEMTGPTVTVAPIQTTTYTVTANLNGCTNTAEVTVEVHCCPLPDAIVFEQDVYSSNLFGENGIMHEGNFFFKNANFYVNSFLTVSHSRIAFSEGSGMYLTADARLIDSEFTGCAGEKWAGIFAQSHFSATRCSIRNAEVGIHSNVEILGGGQGGIFNNLIIAEGTLGEAGIRMENLSYGVIACNRIDNYQNGLHFVNPNPLPQPGSIQIRANAFKNYSTGILIQGGDVGEQAYFDGLGTVIGPADNRWLDTHPNQGGPGRVFGASTDWYVRSYGSEYDAGPLVTNVLNTALSPLGICSWSGEVGQGWRKANGDKPSSVPEISLYPNPAGNEVNLLVDLGDDEASLRATLYNSKGERTLNIEGLRSREIRTLSLRGVAQGLYVLELHMPDGNLLYKKLQIAR